MKEFQAYRRRPARRGRVLARFILALALPGALPGVGQQVPVEEEHLANGMRVLLVPRHDEPTVAGGWVAHVGSANERPGVTGITHLFEHMMFKGTRTIGTTNYARDLEIIAAQERVREEMRREERQMRAAHRQGAGADPRQPEGRTARYRELEKEFRRLVDEQRALLVKNEFDRLYSARAARG